MKPAILLLDLGPGVLLVLFMIAWVVFFIPHLVADPSGLLNQMLEAFVLGLLLYGWIRLYSWKHRRKKQ